MKNRKRRFIWLGVIILLLIVIVVAKGGSKSAEIEVLTENAEKHDIVEVVSANGKIQPRTEVIITSDVSGEIIYLSAKDGDLIQRGDLLAKINPDIVESAKNRAEATVNTAGANLANIRAMLTQVKARFTADSTNYIRNKTLHAQKVISEAEWDGFYSAYQVSLANVEAAKQNVKAGEFGVKSSQATLKEARDNLGRTSIYSPIDGTVSRVDREKGERVVGTEMMQGTEIMRIANMQIMEVHVEVNENDIVRVTKGDTCDVEVDAYSDKKFRGVVTEIANSANVMGASMDQVTNFAVKIEILRDSYKDLVKAEQEHISPFRPGMSATVEIRTEMKNNVLAVPIQSVTTREDTSSSRKPWEKSTDEDEGGEDVEPMECVFVFSNGKAKLKVVETGIQDTKYIEVRAGLKEGDEIIAGPYDAVSRLISNGDDVKAVSKEELFEGKR